MSNGTGRITEQKDTLAKKKEQNYIESKWMRIIISTIRAIALIARDFGIPIASFSIGVVLLFHIKDNDSYMCYQYLIASGLIVIGIFTHLLIYLRENPKKESNVIVNQLIRMTKIIEKKL